MARSREREPVGPRSLTRLLGLFEVLAKASDGQTLAELNVVLKSPKSSLLNLLRPLVAEGYLTYEGARYGLGPAIFRLSSSIVSVWNFSSMLRPYLRELAERSQETVFVGVLDRVNRAVVFVDAIQSLQTLRYSAPVGTTRPLYCTAAGHVLLAFGDKKFQTEYLRTAELEPRTLRTITTREALRDELERVQQSGCAVTYDEMYQGAAAISAPVFRPDGKVLAAFVIGGPTDRLKQQLPILQRIITDVATRASGISPKVSLAMPGTKKTAGAARKKQVRSRST